MYLKSLTVRGFKSFAQATVFEFEPGLNVLVGPNGSGKSNVVDALAWVMGAQGAKALRGAAMKDVIFSGGSAQAALGRARVELVIDNTDRSLPVALDEVKIARTMFSAGGSDYEINGEPARLGDVQDLLADTGVGRDLHTLIGQGQVDRILHGTSADRRELIEQAAGLLKHRRRQAKTAGKLDDLKADLNRLEDVATELESQLEGRREQADAARMASEVASRVRTLTADVLRFDALAVQREREQLEQGWNKAGATRQQAQLRSEELGEQLAATERQLDQQRDQASFLAEHRAQLQTLAHRVETVQLIASERAGSPLSDEHNEEVATRLERAQQVRDAELEQAKDAAARLRQAQKLIARRREQGEAAEKELAQARDELAQADERADKHRKQVSELTSQLAAARASFERAEGELARRRQEQDEFSRNQGEATGRLESAHRERAEAADAVVEAQQKEKVARTRRVRAVAKVDSARTRAHEAELEVESLQSRCQALEAAWANEQSASGDAVAREEAQAGGAQEILSLLDVAEPWQTAVSSLLGAYATALVNTDGTGIEGKVSQVFAPPASQPAVESSPLSEASPDIDGVDELWQAISASDYLKRALSQLWGTVYLCDSLETARRAIAHCPDATAAVIDGTLLTATSLLLPGAARGSLELFGQLQSSRKNLQLSVAALEQAQSKHEQAQQALTDAQAAEKAAAHAAGQAQSKLTQADSQLVALKATRSHETAEATRLNDAVKRATASYRIAQKHLTSATKALDQLPPQAPSDRAALDKAVLAATDRLTEIQSKLAQAQAEAASAESSQQTAQARLAQAESALAAVTTSYKTSQERRTQAIANRTRAEGVTAKAIVLRRSIHALLAAADAELSAARRSQAQTEQALAKLRAEQESAQRSLADALTLHAEAAATRARLEARWEALETRAAEELSLSPAQLVAGRDVHEVDRQQVEAELGRARDELARLGVTNPLALEEYEALQQRHDYLRQQIHDVRASRADVRAVMKDVTEHIDAAFTAALADVQAEFSRIFALLFPGGEGQLILADPHDPGRSGLDIQVKPAGKKVTRLSLLSGGERTLASLALLLATFMARPAPFYVLDEVDAALDDRNLGRLLQVLEQLREKSQLMLITHHQRTMAQADTLYGISMRDGVSTVLSHRMSDPA
ncbi:chromosome segregation protein SMC [Rothia nasisuis]|uniref:chromosome segregation protein SMC n=1 Tax=Rothia nasisuis TaxID=2109647 RepID=UPI001F0067E2|nr:chromosome segregation protein SMC [Rothia nasisuis]